MNSKGLISPHLYFGLSHWFTWDQKRFFHLDLLTSSRTGFYLQFVEHTKGKLLPVHVSQCFLHACQCSACKSMFVSESKYYRILFATLCVYKKTKISSIMSIARSRIIASLWFRSWMVKSATAHLKNQDIPLGIPNLIRKNWCMLLKFIQKTNHRGCQPEIANAT